MKWSSDEDIRSLSLFPYAPASVCTLWRNVLLTFPPFWTRLVIFVDEHPTPLSDVQKYLCLTKNHPLEVHVIRRDGGSMMDLKSSEQLRVKAVMTLLIPHVQRCRTLCFEVIQRSSLPLIGQDFYGKAPLLKKLKMDCEVDDGDEADGSMSEALEEHEDLSFSSHLRELAVDGQNFRWFCDGGLERISGLHSLKRLTLSHFTSFQPKYALTVTKLCRVLMAMPRLQHLHNNNVKFVCDRSVLDEVDFVDRSMVTLHLADLSDGVADIILPLIYSTESLTIKRCSLDAIDFAPISQHLTLEGIRPTDDLARYLALWDNNTVTFRACPGLNDAVLRVLSDGFPELKHLHLVDCNAFSIVALREFVQARMDAVSLFADTPVGRWRVSRPQDWDLLSPLKMQHGFTRM